MVPTLRPMYIPYGAFGQVPPRFPGEFQVDKGKGTVNLTGGGKTSLRGCGRGEQATRFMLRLPKYFNMRTGDL